MTPFWVTALVALQISVGLSGAVSLGRLGALTRGQLLELDREVSRYYNESYGQLDGRQPPVKYEEQLFRSIRSLRHTVVLNIFDYHYSRNETKWASMGAKVDKELCRHQLRLLVDLANKTQALRPDEEAPLSVVDFLEASGTTGAGVLNGNFAWLGAFHSCVRAKIPTPVWRRYLAVPADELKQVPDINGRYCVAHLRAKSWPKWDDYFEDRLTIKRGICVPETCHTAIYEGDDEMERLMDFLARVNLARPFNTDRFETSEVYCLPDEDSPFRQMDLGAKLFVAFVAFWTLLTIYTNVKYYKRLNAMQKLRETVDIKMIINEKLDDIASNYRGDKDKDDDDDDDEEDVELLKGQNRKMAPPKAKADNAQIKQDSNNLMTGQRSGASSAQSSAATTPLPSGVDEDDSDTTYGLIRPFSQRHRKKRPSKGSANYNYARAEKTPDAPKEPVQSAQSASDSLDFIRAFSFEANLNFLFKPRPNEDNADPRSRHLEQIARRKQRGSQQLAAVARRSSHLNEALVKDLNEISAQAAGKVSIESSSGEQGGAKSGQREGGGAQRRVDIDVLDGMKVIATSWIVWGHTMMFFFGLLVDLRFGTERMFDITMLTTINTLQVVGLFYIITGCLLTYFSFNKAKVRQLLNPVFWLLVLVGRYIRLIPAYALVFWFVRHVAPHTGSGPGFYDYRTDEEHPRGACALESWWTMWSMSAADIKIPMDCIPQAWYLSDDFRTLLVLPVYVFLLAKSTLAGYSAILATFAYSNFRLAQILRVAKIDYRILLNWHPHVYALMADRLHEVYTNAAVRMSTYLLGVIVGHLLYLYETRYIRQWPGWFRACGMKAALLVASCFFLGAPILASPLVNQFLPGRDEIHSDLIVWIIPLFKSAMELSICVMILLLVTGGGYGFVRKILASQAMKILSNISYAVFLVHVEIMYKLPAHQLESDYWHLFKHAIFFIMLAHITSFFLHLFYEMPVHFITRHLFKRAFKMIS